MAVKDLSFQEIKNKQSKGWSWTDFESRYGITENELKKHIIGLCQKRQFANRIIKGINKNAKKCHKAPKTTAVSKQSIEPKSTIVSNQPENYPIAQSEIQQRKPSHGERIAELKRSIEEQREVVIQYELKHKQLMRQHKVNVDALYQLECDIAEISELLVRKGKEYEDLVRDTDEIVASMTETSQARHSAKVILDDYRQQVDDLENVSIYVYTNGTISLDNEGLDIMLDDSGSDELFMELVANDACQDLRICDLRALARLLSIIKHADYEFREVVIEVKDLETAFTALRQA